MYWRSTIVTSSFVFVGQLHFFSKRDDILKIPLHFMMPNEVCPMLKSLHNAKKLICHNNIIDETVL